MTQLAIIGHKTRGKEVIEILEMLGGINQFNLEGSTNQWYVLEENRTIRLCELIFEENGFTLEEFLEKFPYKVGDKVQHKGATSCGSVFEVEKMRWVDERVEYTVKRLWYHNGYSVVTAKDLQPFEEETMDKAVFDANAQCCDIMNHLIKKEAVEERKYADLRLDVDQDDKLATEATIDGDKITPPDNYLIGKITKVDNGMLVEFVKKQPQYPNTYVACCEILYPNENFQTVAQTIKGHHGKKLFALQKLLVCRDAYWKIAGEQMGLGKPWKPDWEDQEKATIKYCICISGNVISKDKFYLTNFILSFPTEEMRDAFYENFKYLIESCKELL